MVTQLLEKAIAAAAELPAEDQDTLASLMLQELSAEARWTELLTEDPGKLTRLAEQALEEIRAGRTKELDPGKL